MMKHKTKEILAAFQKKAMVPVIGMTTALMMSVSAFAAEGDATATIDPALFDPLVSGVTGNVNAVLPKILIVVGLLVGLGVVIALFKKHAKPS